MDGPIGLKTLDKAYGLLELFGGSREVLNGDLPFKEVFLLILANLNSQADSAKVPLLPSEFSPLDGEENLKTKLGVMFGESEPSLIFREIEKMNTWEKISEQIFPSEDRRESLKEDLDAYRAIALAYFHFLQERLGIEDYQSMRANPITPGEVNFSSSQERINSLLEILRRELLQRLSEDKESDFSTALGVTNEEKDISYTGLLSLSNEVPAKERKRWLDDVSPAGERLAFEKPSILGDESKKKDSTLSGDEALRIKGLEVESLNPKNISKRGATSQEEMSNLENLLMKLEREFENLLHNSSLKDSQISRHIEGRDATLNEVAGREIIKEFEKLPLELKEAFKKELKALRREIEGTPLEQGLIDHVKAMGPRIREVASEGLEERIIHRVSLDHLSNFIKDFSTELFPTGEKRARIQLEPPELGKMELEVKVLDKEVEIRAKVEKPETFAQLQQDLAQLKSQLEELGLRLKEFELLFGFAEGKGYAEYRRSREERGGHTSEESPHLGEQDPQIYHTGRLYKIV